MALQRPNYTPSSNAAIQIFSDLAAASRVRINGLNSFTPPNLDRASFDVSEFGKIGLTVAGLTQLGMMQFGGNFIFGDPGLSELADRLLNYTKFTDLWCYLFRDPNNPQNDIIMMPDLANDPDCVFQVKQISPGQGAPNGVYPGTFELTSEGLVIYATVHAQDDGSGPDIGFTATTITAASTNFITAGFLEGMSVYIDDLAGVSGGITNAGKMVKIAAGGVAAGVLTLDPDAQSAPILVDAVGAGTVVLRGGRLGA